MFRLVITLLVLLRSRQLTYADNHTDSLSQTGWFTDNIFIKFSTQDAQYSSITKEAFEQIMDLLHLEIGHDRDHGVTNNSLKHEIVTDNKNYSLCYTSEELFEIFGVEQVNVLTKSQFQKMNPSLIWMLLHDECYHDDDHTEHRRIENNLTHLLPHDHWFVDEIFKKYSTLDAQYVTITKEAFEKLMGDLHLQVGHDHDHEHKILKHDTLAAANKTCYSSEELIEIFGVANADVITKTQFEQMGPALTWMLFHEECLHSNRKETKQRKSNPTQRYLFGILAIFITWLISQACVLTIGKINKHKVTIILILQGFAAGNLLGDALFHLIPSALGLHSHSHDDHGHDHGAEAERDPRDPIWKMCAVVGTVFIFWSLECLMQHHHGHSHDIGEINSPSINNVDETEFNVERNPSASSTRKVAPNTMAKIKSNSFRIAKIIQSLKKVHPNGWVAFLGDCLHKAADGLATGAAFSASLSLGVSTALAVLFHEIPHELGDFAVLQQAGFKLYYILFINSLASLCALIAFLIVASVSTSETVQEWIFTVVIGVFLYIALINLMPKLRSYFEKPENIKDKKKFFLVMGAFLAGIVIMLLIAIFEDDIRITF